MLTVSDATLVSIEVSPATPSVPNGMTQQFTATGLYTDNSTQNITTQVTWASSNSAVATVSDDVGSNGRASTTGTGSTTVSATSGDVTGNTTLTVTDATLVSIEVSPGSSQAAAGTTAQFTATGLYSDNSTQNLTTQVDWASSDEAVATLSNTAGSNGRASAVSAGSTTVLASSGGVTGDATFTVTDATLVSIEVSPALPSIANGLTQQFAATGRFTDNSTQDLTTQVVWASSNDTVAMVSNAPGSNGLATTAEVGSAVVYATSGDVTGDTTLTVTDATLVSIEVSPPDPSIVDGLTQQLTATGLYTDSSIEDLTADVTWASTVETVATVSNAPGLNGLASAAGVGSTVVTAAVGDVVGDTTLTVTDATLVSIVVSPADPSIASGLSQQFTATGHYTDASVQDLTAVVTWASSVEAVATVSNTGGFNGLASAAATGDTTISATSGVISGETTLTVTDATLVSIVVSPPDPSIANGLSQQLTAIGHYTDTSTEDLTATVTWLSLDEDVVTVSNAGSPGLATTAGEGSTTVSATSGVVTGGTTFTVTDATLVSIDVSPVNPSVANGLPQQFTAMGHYTDNSTQDLTTTVAWASDDEDVATISNAPLSHGLATTAGEGVANVTATSGTVTGGATLTVTEATLVSIDVLPATSSIIVGSTEQFTATGHYTDDSMQDLTEEVTWLSLDEAVATVSDTAGSKGLASAATVGSTTVSATSGVLTDEATLTVIAYVPTVEEMVADLLVAVTGVGPPSLAHKVEDVQEFLLVPDIGSACGMLVSFKNQVSALSGGSVPVAVANQLTADANAIMAAIPCL